MKPALKIISNLKNVSKVISQKTIDYTDNLISIKPDFVIHGDDWRLGAQTKTRDDVIYTLAGSSRILIEISYTKIFWT